ncbi:hypothetical protein [Paenibacillus wynnii]|uniref:hypothetical protein n=1 Tax=Paenibacillus wynnii TaxID=268407 RepID=UPI00278F429A|nr:hypothetical protein [Paenibacillus wynnii]MDQ0193610.1 hypothetical protein [Paenibacillus wynnii]
MNGDFQYQNFNIHRGMVAESKSLRLENLYELSVNELGLQQKKRDQTIAFYIAVISFVIPAIINMKASLYAKGSGFLALYVLGVMLVQVVMRYRIYKEVYWITCRTITQLFQYKEDQINKDLIQHLYYKNIVINSNTVLVLQGTEERKEVNFFKTFRKIQNSAETILYNVMVLMFSLVLWIATYMLIPFEGYNFAIATVFVLVNLIYWSRYYYKHLTKIYEVVLNKKDDSFNAVFSKAWFLHMY